MLNNNLTFKVSEETLEKIDMVKTRNKVNITRSEIVRLAIHEFLGKYTKNNYRCHIDCFGKTIAKACDNQFHTEIDQEYKNWWDSIGMPNNRY